MALQLDDFLDATDRARAVALRQRIAQSEQEQRQITAARSQADLQLGKAQSTVQAERETLANWLATRRATQRADQDPEVIARTRRLEELKQLESLARQAVQAQQQVALSVVPALFGWLAVASGLPALLSVPLLMLAFALLYFADLRAVHMGLAPAWYPALRKPLTLVVLLCLAVTWSAF